LGAHGFCFSFGKNITLPFAFGWVVMVFVLPLAKTSHCLLPLVGWSWFLFCLWQKHHIAFSLWLGGDGFCFSFGKNITFFVFLPCWELKTEQWLFASKLKKYLTKSLSSSLQPSLPKRT
jgi:hypothetical protein